MTTWSDYRKIQGAFLVAQGTVQATIETADAVVALANWARLRSMVTDPSDFGQWVNAEPFGFFDIGEEIEAEFFAATCHVASAACWVKSAALAAWPFKGGEESPEEEPWTN